MSQGEDIGHFISERGSFLVISLTGSLKHGSVEALERFGQEVLDRIEDKFVIMNLQGVAQVSGDAISWLAQIQREIRGHCAELRVCFGGSPAQEKLARMGVLRRSESAPSVEEALRSLAS